VADVSRGAEKSPPFFEPLFDKRIGLWQYALVVGKEWVMKSYDINGHLVVCDNHGYRTRFYSPTLGYIGSYFKATKSVGYSNGGTYWFVAASGPKTAAKICLAKALAPKE
jgi:hypothetical protein